MVDKNEQIKDIKLKNSYNIADYRRGKMTVLDIKAAERNGRIEGIKEGEQQKEILIVKKLLLMGMDTDCMSEPSGLYEKKLNR
ncbi:hypothetical protein [Clostridium sp. DMHC 10]|uniref:hypothetical protein n=1 Tax=Clostridium sp. DMHC 10 TaxID=747377 RepID=UPI00325A710A